MAEGAGEDESADQAFRVFAVNTYLKVGFGLVPAWISVFQFGFLEHTIIAAPGKVHSVGHSGAGRDQVPYHLAQRIVIASLAGDCLGPW